MIDNNKRNWWQKLWNIHTHEFVDKPFETYIDKYVIVTFHKCKYCNLCEPRETRTALGRKLDEDVKRIMNKVNG